MAEPRRLTDLAKRIADQASFPEADAVVALSGGADSATLAAIAADVGTVVRCVHVHHGLPASDRLAEAAVAVAEKIGLDVQVTEVELAEGPSPEAVAREARYAAFAQQVSDHDALLLGHTENDQAETIILNLVRGAGLKGMTGMPYHRPPNIYRPLLGVTRDETREYAMLRGLPFHDDPTNFDRTLRRNEIRLDILPRLEDLNPQVIASLAAMGETIRSDAEYLEELAGAHPTLRLGDGAVGIPVGVLTTLHSAVRARVLATLVGDLRSSQGLSREELARIEEVAFGLSARTELEGRLTVRVDRALLVVSKGS